MSSPAIAAETLQQGQTLLEEQRLALLAHDPDALSAANHRLSAWLHGLRGTAAQPREQPMPKATHAPDSSRVRDLAFALEANAMLAQRHAARAARALETLVPSSRATYTSEGRASTSLPRRGKLKA